MRSLVLVDRLTSEFAGDPNSREGVRQHRFTTRFHFFDPFIKPFLVNFHVDPVGVMSQDPVQEVCPHRSGICMVLVGIFPPLNNPVPHLGIVFVCHNDG